MTSVFLELTTIPGCIQKRESIQESIQKRLQPAVAADCLACDWTGQHRLRVVDRRWCRLLFSPLLANGVIKQAAIEPVLHGTPSAAEMLWWKTRITATRKRLKITGATTQPCLTPVFTPKLFDIISPCTTRSLILVWSSRKMLRKPLRGGTQICPRLTTTDLNWRYRKPL